MLMSTSSGAHDYFKPAFKYYKSRAQLPDLGDLICPPAQRLAHMLPADPRVILCTHIISSDPRCQLLGLSGLTEWRYYYLRDHPGLIFIPNPFTLSGQRYWIRRCLEEYPNKPNKTNLDNEVKINDWWSYCNSIEKNSKYLKKLRWATLGYHHDWDTKMYSEDNRSQFPEDLAELCDLISYCLGYPKFVPEAAIVNYYHMDSTLSAHTDHSEQNLDAPLYSISLGQSAIFLIGGQDKSKKPSPILLQSGDILIMSKESRLCYHAVPKILSATCCPWNDCKSKADEDEETHTNQEISEAKSEEALPTWKYLRDPVLVQNLINFNEDDENWESFDDYVQNCRININIRQVCNYNENSLS